MPKYLEDWEAPASRYAQFYTKPLIARACWSVLHGIPGLIPSSAFYVEPSAGAGAFYSLMPSSRRFACDIDPHPDCPVLSADFLTYPVDQFLAESFVVVVGNPPFGLSRVYSVQTEVGFSDISSAFFNRCALFADVIAFVLPVGYSLSSRSRWHLEFDAADFECVSEFKLPSRAFNYGSTDFGYPCVFQVWRRIRPKLNA